MTVTTPLGRVLRDEDGVRLEFVRTYGNPIDDVWSALTDPDRVARWIGTWTGDPATGTVDLVMTDEEGSSPEPSPFLSANHRHGLPSTCRARTAPGACWFHFGSKPA